MAKITKVRGRAKSVRKLSNAPDRAQRTDVQPVRTSFRRGTLAGLGLGKRKITRLIKRDPSKGITQPYFDDYTETAGVAGLSGPPNPTVMIADHSPAPGTGRSQIKNRGVNTKLTKR